MGAPAQSASKRPPAATLILIGAALIALVSAGIALTRSSGGAAPDNPAAKDWRVVGWAYAQSGDARASADAYRKATILEPGLAENWSSLGEALQTASPNIVPEAAAAFRKALALDPADPRARYFLAVQKDLGGDHKGAIEDWLALLKDTPPGAPWEADVRRTVEQSAAKNHIDLAGRMPAPGAGGLATAGIPGPTPEQIASASSIPPGQQDAMVKAMVQKLEDRLKASPKDADGWIRLMRSKAVLNDPAGAKDALRSGLAAFQGDGATQARLNAAAAELGIGGG
jgi:cytochrome c-type biogenesis protein CcmH